LYEAAWDTGGLRFRGIFRDLVTSNEANATAVAFLKDKIRKIVKDPATAEKLADIDHPYAAKRPPIDTDYFETFNRDNVMLVDVRADPSAHHAKRHSNEKRASIRWTSSSSPRDSTA